jgi:YVTN family beta-propeller protein
MTSVDNGVGRRVNFAELRTVEVGPGPHAHIGYVKETGEVWVSDTGGNTITVLDHADGAVLARWEIGGGPAHFSFDQGCELGLVALRSADQAAVINPKRREVVARVDLPSGSAPTGTMPAFDRRLVYTLNQGDATTTAVDIDRHRVTASIPVGGSPMWGQPWGASYKPITKPVGKTYVVSTDTDDVTVFDDVTNVVLRQVKVGRRPNRNAIFREHSQLYVSNEADDTITIIRIADDEVLATVPVGHRPFRMLPIAAINGRDEMWVLNAGTPSGHDAGQISAVQGEQHVVSRSIDTVDRPANWVVSPEKMLFIVSGTAKQMQIIDLLADREVGATQLSHHPEQGAISGLIFTAARTLFVLNADNTVSLFRTNDDS